MSLFREKRSAIAPPNGPRMTPGSVPLFLDLARHRDWVKLCRRISRRVHRVSDHAVKANYLLAVSGFPLSGSLRAKAVDLHEKTTRVLDDETEAGVLGRLDQLRIVAARAGVFARQLERQVRAAMPTLGA